MGMEFEGLERGFSFYGINFREGIEGGIKEWLCMKETQLALWKDECDGGGPQEVASQAACERWW